MTFDPQATPLNIGIVGTGVMGRGIAQIAAVAGLTVFLNDARPGAAAEAIAGIGRQFARLAEKGKMSAEAAEAARSRLREAQTLDGLASCHAVVEAIVENLDVKRDLVRQLELLLTEDAIIASNTSSLSVTAIAAEAKRPERIVGFHFFNPVPLMKLVEVVPGLRTAEALAEGMMALARRLGHRPVRTTDTPGFLVNHAGRGYGTEALRILGEGVADTPAIDRILREGAEFRMGPFELLDLTGLDVSHPVMESIYHQFYEEPRFRPSVLTRQRQTAGLLGRKTGRGFYAYEGDKQIVPPEIPPPTARPAQVWVSPVELASAKALSDCLAGLGAPVVEGPYPPADALCLVTPIGEDCTTTILAQGLDPRRTLAVETLTPLDRRRTLMTNPAVDSKFREAAHGLLAADGVPVTVIHDSPGFVAQRVMACIVNVACEIAQCRIATPSDIDLAVTLGLGYPQGPLALGDRLGAARVLRILNHLRDLTGDPRYRPSLWLARRARLGLPLTTPEA